MLGRPADEAPKAPRNQVDLRLHLLEYEGISVSSGISWSDRLEPFDLFQGNLEGMIGGGAGELGCSETMLGNGFELAAHGSSRRAVVTSCLMMGPMYHK